MELETKLGVGTKYAFVPINEYKELLTKSLRVDILCDMIEAGEYLSMKEVMFVFGMMKQKEDGESV